MATWTNIPTDRIEPGKPIRAIDGLALRDNPIAIAQGASGAPRIVAAGLASNSVTTVKIVNQNVTAAKLATGGNENAWVLARIGAGTTAGGVGTYAFVIRLVRSNASGRVGWGGTTAGSALRPASLVEGSGGAIAFNTSQTLTGTWRVMGFRTGMTDTDPYIATLAVRIS